MTGLARARPAQQADLANAFLERGQFYLDLYEYERLLVLQHASMRDSLAKKGGPATPAAAYVLARANHELGRDREALAGYRGLGNGVPSSVRSAAAAWAATLSPGGGGRSWQQELTNWRTGRDARPPACAPRAGDCELVRAILASDLPALERLQRELARDRSPDVLDTLQSNTGNAVIELFDPLMPYLLAAADFALAEAVVRGVARAEAVRGLALLRLRRFDEAAALLKTAAAAAGTAGGQLWALAGEALAGAGKAADAEDAWKRASAAAANWVADSRSAARGDASFAMRQFSVERAAGFARLRSGANGGISLARALVRGGRASEAVEVLEAVRPLSQGANLNAVRPYVLVLASRAQFVLGQSDGMRDRFAPARGDLVGVANDVPQARPALAMLQQITAPSSFPAGMHTVR
ncbi:MAG: hypothetical protein IPK33_02990 [Gemmatimonadetes bacterium]|nr:hypothetical protein [Gemmatimonadota bacterium]